MKDLWNIVVAALWVALALAVVYVGWRGYLYVQKTNRRIASARSGGEDEVDEPIAGARRVPAAEPDEDDRPRGGSRRGGGSSSSSPRGGFGGAFGAFR